MEKYRELEVFEYEKAVKSLSSKELEFLKEIYSFPSHVAPAKEIAIKMGQTTYQWSNNVIATIGKKISESSGVAHPNYVKDVCSTYDYKGPAYFMFIGPYFKCEGRTKGSKDGWQMKDNLCEALRTLGYVIK
jgi:hypothetical protein